MTHFEHSRAKIKFFFEVFEHTNTLATGVFNSSPVIGTDSCYSSFERGNKTVQAKIIKICVGGPKCVGGAQNHLHQYDVLLHIHDKIAR